VLKQTSLTGQTEVQATVETEMKHVGSSVNPSLDLGLPRAEFGCFTG